MKMIKTQIFDEKKLKKKKKSNKKVFVNIA